jgi:uncharacterized membrane protein
MKRSPLALGLALLLGAAGAAHFVRPEPFDSIVPPVLGEPRPWVLISGVAEIACAGLLASAKTRRLGALAAIVLFVAVFPANVYAALTGGYSGLPEPFNTAAAAYARLPLQALLIWWAWSIYRQDRADG